MAERVKTIETFFFESPRDELYLGPLGPGDIMTESGYLVRAFSGTVYPSGDRSVIVRVTTESGIVGWGETYGLVAPRVIAELMHDLVFGFVRTFEDCDPEKIHDFLYGLMRVRGYSRGFWLDALAALDIALWDIKAKAAGVSIARLIDAGPRTGIGAYISGLPAETLKERVAMAEEWSGRGFDRFKIKLESFIHTEALVEGVRAECAALRAAIGDRPEISVDMHWLDGVDRVLAICDGMAAYRPWFVEAPCMPEAADNLAAVCAGTPLPIAIGEEWRTVFDAAERIRLGIAILQPEMGHTGITEFLRIGRLAAERGKQLVPHATIGMGIFLTASLQASAALGVEWHEFQHSVMGKNRRYIDGQFSCEDGRYAVPDAAGLGVEPSEDGFRCMTLMSRSG